MNSFRRHCLRSRIAWLALLGLLWTQVMFAGHGPCILDALTGGPVAVGATTQHECHDAPAYDSSPSVESVVCTAHCGQGDQNTESGRVLVFAALPAERWPLPAITPLADQHLARPQHDGRGPRHRPTTHPATLLLI